MNVISVKELAIKTGISKEVIYWHIERALKNQILVKDEDVTSIGRGYALTQAAVIWLASEVHYDDFRKIADIVSRLSEFSPVAEIKKLQKLNKQQSYILSKMLGEEPEEEPKANEDTVPQFSNVQQEYWTECLDELRALKKATGHSRRAILKTVYDICTTKYGIVWSQLMKDVAEKYGFDKGWVIKGMGNMQAVCFSDDTTRSIFKAVLKDYPNYICKEAQA